MQPQTAVRHCAVAPARDVGSVKGLDQGIAHCRQIWLRRLAQLRRFEHFKVPKWLRLLRLTPKGRHYSGIGGTGPAVILGGDWAGSSSLSFFSNRLSSGSGSV